MQLPNLPTTERHSTALQILNDLDQSGADARDLTQQQIPLLRDLFEDQTGLGFYMFAYWICGCREMDPNLHAELAAIVSRWGKVVDADGHWVQRPSRPTDRDSWRRVMVNVQRGSFKSTVVTRSGSLWKATLDPEITVGIFNEAQDNVKGWLSTILQIVENSHLYQQLWPHVLPRGIHYRDREAGTPRDRSWPWGASGIRFVRQSHHVSELTFEPFGIGGAHTGKHFTHKIYDDIIGEKSATSQAIMDDAIHFVEHGREIERPTGRGAELIVGTRWSYMDVYSWCLRTWPGEYKVYRRALLEDPETREPDVVNGRSIFPSQQPEDWARNEYNKLGFKFMAQYQCQPRVGREQSFEPGWLRYGHCSPEHEEPVFRIEPRFYDPECVHSDLQDADSAPRDIPLSWMEKALLLDPAPTIDSEKNKEPRARNGLVAAGIDPWGRRYLLEARPLREDPTTVLENIVEMCKAWRVRHVGIEEVNFSKIYGPLWTTILYHRYPGLDLAFFPLKPRGRDKDTRISALSAPIRQGLWYFNRTLSEYAVQELLEYPSSETRDLIDALAYVEDDEKPPIARPLSPGEQAILWSRDREQERDLTGYGYA